MKSSPRWRGKKQRTRRRVRALSVERLEARQVLASITLTAIEDAGLRGDFNRDSAEGQDDKLVIYQSDPSYALVKFDLSNVRGMITDAKLEMEWMGSETSGAIVDVYRFATPWSESTVTWNNVRGGNDPFSGTIGFPLDSELSPYLGPGIHTGTFSNWNVTAAAQEWQSGVANHGLFLRAGPSSKAMGFHSTEPYLPNTTPPRLVLTVNEYTDAHTGELDPTFGVGGVAVTSISGSADNALDIVLQPDGKIIAAGAAIASFSSYDFAVARYFPNGKLDPTFGNNGISVTSFWSGNDIARSVALQTDGKIVVAGQSGSQLAVARYNTNGQLDTTFDGDGLVAINSGPFDSDWQSVSVQSDGKILVSGAVSNGNNFDLALVRLNSNGTLDNTFDGDGTRALSVGSGSDLLLDHVTQNDGKIVITGRSHSAGNVEFDMFVGRLNANGSLDNTFDGDGLKTIAFGSGFDGANDVALQPDGKIVLAGSTRNTSNSDLDFAVVRLNTNGSFDTTFDTDGKATWKLSSGTDELYGIRVQKDGKILAAGTIGDDFGLVRLQSNGALDSSFNGNGFARTSLSFGADIAYAIAQQPDGDIVLAGQQNSGNNANFAIARFKGDATPPIHYQSLSPPTSISNTANFGFSVANSGAHQVIGAPAATVNGSSSAGQVFVHDAATGARLHTLQHPTPGNFDRFGESVAIDGTLIVVGASFDSIPGRNSTGSAHIFNAVTGLRTRTLDNPANAQDDFFGTSVAISGDFVAVGSPRNDTGATNAGVVYVFLASTGALYRTIPNPTPFIGDVFGTSVALSGNRLAVGASSGEAYVFDIPTGSLLRTISGSKSDLFGAVVGIEGDYVVVGAPFADMGAAADVGKAYVYSAATGTLLHTLQNPFPSSDDRFGSSVSINGGDVVVGAPMDDGGAADTGSAYLFSALSGNLLGSLSNPTLEPGDQFAASVSIYHDRILIGSPMDDVAGTNKGAAHFFKQAPPPYSVGLSSTSIAENLPSGSVVATISAGAGSTAPVTFRLAAGTGGDDNGSFSIVGNELRTAASFNFEHRSNYSVRVEGQDASGVLSTEVFSIWISDVNEPPTALTVSASLIGEMNDTGAVIGVLTTSDPDQNESFTYSLVPGVGADDNAAFSIDGSQLKAARVFDYESQPQYSIRVRSQDSTGHSIENVLTITIQDVNAPAIDILPTYDVRPVIDLNDTPVSSNPGTAIEIDGTVYFSATTSGHGSELWRTDGTLNGTKMVIELSAGEANSKPRSFARLGNTLIFISTYEYVDPMAPPGGIPEQRLGLFSSDGTTAGTTLLRHFEFFPTMPEDVSTQNIQFTEVGGKLFFLMANGSDQQLWTTNGTPIGTQLVKALPPSPGIPAPGFGMPVAVLGNLFLFNMNVDCCMGTHTLWRSDGTEAGTFVLREVMFGSPGGLNQPDTAIVTTGSKAYFVSSTPDNGKELWSTDGSIAGTAIVKDIWPGSDGATPRFLTAHMGQLYFAADDGSSGTELWRSDGTATGTTRVADIYSGFSSGLESAIVSFGNHVYFGASDGIHGFELWRSNGTAAGTERLTDPDSGPHGLYPNRFIHLGTELLFTTPSFAFAPNQLWRTDGTASGTYALATVGGEQFTVSNGKVYFRSGNGGTGQELWVSDGTSAGTLRLADLSPGTGSGLDTILATGSNVVIFRGESPALGMELGISNGTPQSTRLIDVARGTPPGQVTDVLKIGDYFYLAAVVNNQPSLVKTDGTRAGTVVLKTFLSGPRELTEVNGQIYFAAEGSASQGIELWRSDGTAAGTVLHKDINPGAGDGNPADLTSFDGSVFFLADDGTNGVALWSSNLGDSRATLHTNFAPSQPDDIVLLQASGEFLYVIAEDHLHRINEFGQLLTLAETGGRSIMPWGDIVYFSGESAAAGSELWRTDGTAVGTYLVADLIPGPESSFPGGGVVIEGASAEGGGAAIDAKLVFRALSPSGNGSQLWSTNGTTSGTRQITDFPKVTNENGDSRSLEPVGLTRVGDKLLFEGYDVFHGRELWESGGTPTGTKLVADLRPGSTPDPVNIDIENPYYQQRIESMLAFRDQVFFRTAANGIGKELWTSDGTTAGSRLAINLIHGDPGGHPTNLFVADDKLYFTADTLDYGIGTMQGSGELFYLNESPYVPAITDSVATGNSLTIHLLGRDRDGDELTYEVVSAPNAGSVAIDGSRLTLTPPNGFSGSIEFSYRAFDGSLYSNIAMASVTVHPAGNRIAFATENTTITEQNGVIYVDVALETPATSPLVIPYRILGTEAANDEAGIRQLLAIPAGQTSARIPVRVVDDGRHETQPQVVEITLEPNSEVGLGSVVQHRLVIQDNDGVPTVRFTSPWQTVSESNDTLAVQVGLSAASDEVIYATVDIFAPPFSAIATPNVDYIAKQSRTLEFLPGERVKTIPVRLIDDSNAEPRERIFVQMGDVENAVVGTQYSDFRHFIWIEDNDTSTVNIATTAQFGTEGDAIIIEATRAGGNIDVPLSVPFTVWDQGAAANQDYLFSASGFDFAAGATTASLVVNLVANNTVEVFEALTLQLSQNANYAIGETSSAYIGIYDDDASTPSIRLQSPSQPEFEVNTRTEGGSPVDVVVKLSNPSAQTISVPLFISSGGIAGYATHGADYALDTSNVVFLPGQTEVKRTLTIINDSVKESDEVLRISIQSPDALAQPEWANRDTSATLEIEDNDHIVSLSGPASVKENDGAFQVVATLDQPARTFTSYVVRLSGKARDGRDFRYNSSSSISFVSGEQSKPLAFELINNTLSEAPVELTLELVRDGQVAASYVTTIVDDDALPTPTILSPPKFGLWGTDLDINPMVLVIDLGNASSQKVTMDIELSGPVVAQGNIDFIGAGQGAIWIASPQGLSLTSDNTISGQLQIQPGQQTVTMRVYPNAARIVSDETLEITINGGSNLQLPDTRPSSTREIIDDAKRSPPPPRSNSRIASTNWGALQIHVDEAVRNSNVKHDLNKLNPAPTSTIIPGTLQIGVVENGPLLGGTLFLDANFNGVADFVDLNENGKQDADEPFEPVASSGLDGSFGLQIPTVIDRDENGLVGTHEARFVMLGGTDVSTDLPWRIPLAAPAGSLSLTPINTVVEHLLRRSLLQPADAEEAVQRGLGIDEYDIARGDALNDTLSGDRMAAAAYRQQVTISSLVIALSELVDGRTSSGMNGAAESVYGLLAETLYSSSGPVDFSNEQLLAGFVESLARTYSDSLSGQLASDVGEVLGRAIHRIQVLQLGNFEQPIQFLKELTRVKKLIHGELSAALREVGEGVRTMADVSAQFSESNLDALIAAQQIGQILPPAIGVVPATVVEGNAGQTMLEFVVLIGGDVDREVRVDYATKPGTAIEGADYESVSGTLVWPAGDASPRIVQVPILGDLDFEPDDYVMLQLNNAVNGQVRIGQGMGYILNDDAFSFASPNTSSGDRFSVAHTRERAEIAINGTTLKRGEFASPIDLELTGEDANDDFVVNFSGATYRQDLYQFNGGNGNDSTTIDAGRFQSITHVVQNSVNGATTLRTFEDENLTVTSNSIEYLNLLVNATDVLTVELPASVTEVFVEDAGADDTGTMRIRGSSGEFSPIEFTNPTSLIRIVSSNPATRVTTLSTDPEFFGNIELVLPNEAPIDLELSSNETPENQGTNALVGVFTAIDPDDGDTFGFALVAGEGDTDNGAFVVVGNDLRTVANLNYEAKSQYSIRAQVTDSGGATFEKSFVIVVTDVVEDVTRPTSAVQTLPQNATSLTIPISVIGSDPNGPEEPARGVKEYELYVAMDSGSFQKFATVPANNPQTTYQATSNHTYFFRSVAIDFAGNVEVDAIVAPDTMTRVGDFAKPTTQVTAAQSNQSGLFTLSVSGSDVGSKLLQFDLYVAIDGGSPSPIGSVSAGAPNATNVHSAVANYQGLADGAAHHYRFYSRGVDASGNVEDAPAANQDVSVEATFAAPGGLTASGIDVQLGANQRSHVRYLDVLFSDSTGLEQLLAAGRVAVEKFALDAATVTPGTGSTVSLSGLSQIGDRLRLDFGANGLGGSKTTNAGDGFYRLRLDVNGDGDFNDPGDSAFEFHRLYGDANGDGIVDTLDTAVVDSLMGRTGANLDGDVDGSGTVNILDKNATVRQRGRKLANNWNLLRDD